MMQISIYDYKDNKLSLQNCFCKTQGDEVISFWLDSLHGIKNTFFLCSTICWSNSSNYTWHEEELNVNERNT